jgi:hypothetical protein
MGKGAKAGFLAGLIYSITLSMFTLLSLFTLGMESFIALLSELTGLPRGALVGLYYLTLFLGPLVVFIFSLVMSVIFGVIYSYIADRTNKEWTPLLALVIGAVEGLVLGLTINLPISRTVILGGTTALSLTYSIPLYLLHRRYSIKFDPKWLQELGEEDKAVLRTLERAKLKFHEIKEKTGIEDEKLRQVLKLLEGKDYVDIDFENRYRLTEKGRVMTKHLI